MTKKIYAVLKALYKGKTVKLPCYRNPIKLSQRGWIGWSLDNGTRCLFCDVTLNQFISDLKSISDDHLEDILNDKVE